MKTQQKRQRFAHIRGRPLPLDEDGGVVLRMHLWLEYDQANLIGPGRVRLLRKIEELGSLRQAAEAMGMSYRAAWGKLKATEAHCGRALVCKMSGKGNRFGLTPFARELMQRYKELQDDVAAYAQQRGKELFTGPGTIEVVEQVENVEE
jgi:molybdate transport system regulatory protein